MNSKKTIEKSVRIALFPHEDKILSEYLETNGLKLRGLVRLLIIKELKEKNVLKEEGYVPPKIQDCIKKSKR